MCVPRVMRCAFHIAFRQRCRVTTHWFIRLVLPTPESPRMMTFNNLRFLPGAIARICGWQYN